MEVKIYNWPNPQPFWFHCRELFFQAFFEGSLIDRHRVICRHCGITQGHKSLIGRTPFAHACASAVMSVLPWLWRPTEVSLSGALFCELAGCALFCWLAGVTLLRKLANNRSPLLLPPSSRGSSRQILFGQKKRDLEKTRFDRDLGGLTFLSKLAKSLFCPNGIFRPLPLLLHVHDRAIAENGTSWPVTSS